MTDEKYILVFQDEVHFQLRTSVAQKWALKGSKPKVSSVPGRKNIPYSGYVIPKTGELITTKLSWFNYETVIQSYRDFLDNYSVAEGKKVCMVIDNAPWHKKAYRLVQEEALEEYSDIREKIELIKLPRYSPDLNPIEQLWRKARYEITHNRFFKNLKDLRSALASFFRKFIEPNDEIVSLCRFDFTKERHSASKHLWVGIGYKLCRKNMAQKSIDEVLVPI